MCELCTQHGEGEKWYLTMENYSKDLLDQNKRARIRGSSCLNRFDKRVPKSVYTTGQNPQDAADENRQAGLDPHAKTGSLRPGGADGRCRKDLRHGAGGGATAVRVPARDDRQHERALLLRLDHG